MQITNSTMNQLTSRSAGLTLGKNRLRYHMSANHALAALRKYLMDFSKTSMANYNLNIEVLSTSGVTSSWSEKSSTSQHCCEVDIQGERYIVRISRLGQETHFTVSCEDSWIPFGSILTALASNPSLGACIDDSMTEADKLLQWHQQASWWMDNGKTFHFFRLPAEIREMIYNYIFVGDIHPFPYARSRRLAGLSAVRLAQRNPPVSGLALNRIYYSEASHVMFEHSRFFVNHASILRRLLRQFSSVNIRNLVLSLDHESYLDAFPSLPLPSGDERASNSHAAAQILRHLNLKSLRLIIAQSSHGDVTESNIQHKLWVSHVCLAALPYIRYHPVTIEGHVCDSQKIRLNMQFSTFRERFEKWLAHRPLGCVSGTPMEYDVWLADDGGVVLP